MKRESEVKLKNENKWFKESKPSGTGHGLKKKKAAE